MAKMLVVSRTIEDKALDLTPMLDLLFILAIFFWLSTSVFAVASETVAETLSVEDVEAVGKPKILVEINENNQIFLNGYSEPIDPRFVRSRYDNLRDVNPDAELVMRVHADSNPSFVELVQSLPEEPWICDLEVFPETF